MRVTGSRIQDGVPRDCQESNEAHANTDPGPGSGCVYTRCRPGKKSVLLIILIVTLFSIIREFCPDTEVPSIDSANLIKHLVMAPTKFRKLSNTSITMFQDTRLGLDQRSPLHLPPPRRQQPPRPLHQYHNWRRNKVDGWRHYVTLAKNTIWEKKVRIQISACSTQKQRSSNHSSLNRICQTDPCGRTSTVPKSTKCHFVPYGRQPLHLCSKSF